MIFIPCHLPFHQSGEQVADPVRREELMHEALRHQSVEFFQRDGSALIGLFAFLRTRCAGVLAVAAGSTSTPIGLPTVEELHACLLDRC